MPCRPGQIQSGGKGLLDLQVKRDALRAFQKFLESQLDHVTLSAGQRDQIRKHHVTLSDISEDLLRLDALLRNLATDMRHQNGLRAPNLFTAENNPRKEAH